MRNKTFLIIGAVILGIGLFYLGTSFKQTKSLDSQSSSEPTVEKINDVYQITIKDYVYLPVNLKIKVGESVNFTNLDEAPHTATADDGSWGTKLLKQNESEIIKFDKPGNYPYYCKPHPNMQATITVE